MPYIQQINRVKFEDKLSRIQIPISTKGELEYCVFKLMLNFMEDKEHNYTSLHSCTYAVVHCADEFRRRYLDKREDEAMEKNGDIK